MIVSVASRRGSPGATTFVGLLASWWAEQDTLRFLLEADEAGGTFAARWKSAHGLTWQPGLIELATLPEPDISSLQTNSQQLPDGLQAVAAPPSPGQVFHALQAIGDEGAATLARLEGLRAFVDCGRLTRRSAAINLARRSVVTILLCRAELEDIYGMLAGVVELRDAGCNVGLVVVGGGRWPPEEIAKRAEVPLLGVLPNDPKGGRLVCTGGLVRSRRFERTALAKAMDELTPAIQSFCAVHHRPVDVHAPGVTPMRTTTTGTSPTPGPWSEGQVSPAIAAATALAVELDDARPGPPPPPPESRNGTRRNGSEASA